MENELCMIVVGKGLTRLWIANTPGVFRGCPNLVWKRELSKQECESLLINPHQLFSA